MLGIGAMLHVLGGGSEHSATEYYGRKIISAKMDDDRLTLGLCNGKTIQIWDDGQSCCESRYMRTDDDVNDLVGGVINRIEAKSADSDTPESDYGSHEVVFVEVGTDKGHISISNHNEHNGYYGGFGLKITEMDAADAK